MTGIIEGPPTLGLQIFVLISGVIQVALFIYHFAVHESKLKAKTWLDILATILIIFFIIAIVLTSMGYKWCIIDLTIYSFEDAGIKHLIYYIGAFMLLLGNILFVWLEVHLRKGLNSPWYNNDISLSKIDVNIVDLTIIDNTNEYEQEENEDNRILVETGPYKYCRHPTIIIMLFWEFGYGLGTGAWFEFLAFIAFLSVELVHIKTIEKSLLLKYGDSYYQYMQNKNAFFPGFMGKYFCEMGVYINSCICLCLFNQNLRNRDNALLN